MTDDEDDGWGDDAGEGEDDWGSDDGGDDWGQSGSDAPDEKQDVRIEIENKFYEAEGERRSDPAAALEKFVECVNLVNDLEKKNAAELGPDEYTRRFTSLKYIVLIQFKLQQFDEMKERLLEMLSHASEVTSNDSLYALDTVLTTLGESDNSKVLFSVYTVTLDALKKMPDRQRMYFQIAMKLAKEYRKAKDWDKCQALLDECREMNTTASGEDDRSKGSALLEVYACEMQMLTEKGEKNNPRMTDLFERTQRLVADVNDPKVMSVIKECWGRMFASQGKWDRAYDEFYTSFECYNASGNPNLKQILKYIVIANILSGGKHDPFGRRSAKVHETDPEVNPVVLLIEAYRNDQVLLFQEILAKNESTTLSDPFIRDQVKPLLNQLRCKYLLKLIRPYKRVRMDWLAAQLAATASAAESLVVNLILDGSIKGNLDQIAGILDLTPEQPDPFSTTLKLWIQKVKKLQLATETRCKNMFFVGKRMPQFDERNPVNEMIT